jgi:hypothetical protein
MMPSWCGSPLLSVPMCRGTRSYSTKRVFSYISFSSSHLPFSFLFLNFTLIFSQQIRLISIPYLHIQTFNLVFFFIQVRVEAGNQKLALVPNWGCT